MSGDGVLRWIYSTAEFDDAVGQAGCEGPEPANYADHEVAHVPDHVSYYEPGEGCMAQVVDAF